MTNKKNRTISFSYFSRHSIRLCNSSLQWPLFHISIYRVASIITKSFLTALPTTCVFFVINLLIAFKISPTIWLSKLSHFLCFLLNDIDIHLYFLFEFNFFFQTYIFLECGHIVKDNVLI